MHLHLDRRSHTQRGSFFSESRQMSMETIQISLNEYFWSFVPDNKLLVYITPDDRNIYMAPSFFFYSSPTFFHADPCPTYLYCLNTQHYVINSAAQHAPFLYTLYNARRILSNRLLKPKSRIIMGVLLE